MALKKKPVQKNVKPAEYSKYFTISVEKKKKILGIFLMVISFLVFMSLITYSAFDKALLNNRIQDLIKGITSDNNAAQDIRNWLGISGAYISDFFFNGVTGYSSIVFPVVLFIWGLRFFKRFNFRILIHLSNFLLISALIFSTFFGVLRVNYRTFTNVKELSGSVGEYLGTILGRLLGGVGSISLLIALMIAILIFAFDIKIENIFLFVSNLFSRSVNKIKSEYEESKTDLKSESNLEKIKSLRDEKKKKKPNLKFTVFHRWINFSISHRGTDLLAILFI